MAGDMVRYQQVFRILAAALLPCLIMRATPARAAEADGIVGTWLVEDRTGKIRIYRCGDKLCGKTVWIRPTKELPEPEKGLDVKNPDPSKRTNKLIGTTILWGLAYDPDDGRWEGGYIYDSRSGNVYRCEITVKGEDQILLRGYLGISLIGKTTVWTRVGHAEPK